ncbi:MAG: hypothetical protein HY934_10555, partial [Candidatus Firestonebacteria bacterium]|nr:hypothetical protein [Candidatus Firestonebacteria bacterium]
MNKKNNLNLIIIIYILLFLLKNIHAYTWENTKYSEHLVSGYNTQLFSISLSATSSTKVPFPNISFAFGGLGGIYYAYYDSSQRSWKVETIEQEKGVGHDISLEIDMNGIPHVSYTNWYKQNLKYAYFDSSSGWKVMTLDDNPENGRFSVIQIDNYNNPHIAYYDAKDGVLKYIYSDGTTRKREIIDKITIKMVGFYNSFK